MANTRPARTLRVEHQLQRIEALVPAGEKMSAYLRNVLDGALVDATPTTAMGVVPIGASSTLQSLASARMAVELIDTPLRLAEKPEGIVDLGVIEWALRPALPIESGRIYPIRGGPWKSLGPEIVTWASGSICRLELAIEDYEPLQIGSGFLAGEQADGHLIVMTNRHIVEEALRLGWPVSAGVEIKCVFADDPSADGIDLKTVAAQHEIHPHYDLALLYLPKAQFGTGERNPSPLRVARNEPSPVLGLKVGVIGYPSFDSTRDSFTVEYGFGSRFGIKRLSPGYIRAREARGRNSTSIDVALHDATTLSGSSGSCVVDLGTSRVIGLHFGGWPIDPKKMEIGGSEVLAQLFAANAAIPLWTLHDDPLLRDVLFV